MARLTDIHIRNWIKAGTPIAKSFGEGLTFTLSAKLTASWVLRYRFGGKQREVTLGRYPDISIKKATELALKRRIEIIEGVDVAREKQRRIQKERQANSVTELGELYFKNLTERGKDAAGPRWHIDAYITPRIGAFALHEVTPDDIFTLCENIKNKPRRVGKKTAPSSAREVLGTIRRMFDFAIDRRLAKSNPASSIKPKAIGEKKTRERALSVTEMRVLWAAIKTDKVSPTVGLAMQLIWLSLGRKTEITEAKWDEINEETAEWDIPGERTKNGKPHRVYLSSQALAVLKTAKEIGCSSPFVFPGKSSKPIGETTLNEAIKRAKHFGLEQFTIHDSRRTASTTLHEMNWNSDVIEKALNHTQPGVRAIYNRAEYGEQRKELLQAWANFLDSLLESDGNIVVSTTAHTRVDISPIAVTIDSAESTQQLGNGAAL